MIWHTGTPADVLSELSTDETVGITTAEAQSREKEYGKNILSEKKQRSFLERFLGQLQDTMVIILFIAALVSLGLCIYNTLRGDVAEWAEPVVIVAILILNAIIGVIQDSVETAINSSSDALFTAVAEFKQWRKAGKEIQF